MAVKKGKKSRPPEPLVSMTEPSQRHPKGLPRCQYWKIKEGRFWQCTKPAVGGGRTCSSPRHGMAPPARVRRGEKKNPVTASVKTGKHAKPATLKALAQEFPELNDLTKQFLEDEQWYDLQRTVAQAKALLHLYTERATDELKKDGAGSALLKAIDALKTVASLTEAALRVRAGMNAPTREDLARFKHAVLMAFERFVPDDQFDNACRFLDEALTGTVPISRGRGPIPALGQGAPAPDSTGGDPGGTAAGGGGAAPAGS